MSTRWVRVMSTVGIVLVVGSVGFRTAAVPALIRFPTDVDKTLHYTGVYTSYIDEKTLTTRATPLELSFALDRHLKVVRSTASTVVIREDLTFHRASLPTLTQQNQYVMDRRSMELKGGSESWAFTPRNQVDRSGYYRLQFPLGTSASGHYGVWNNETSAPVPLVHPSSLHYHAESTVKVIDFSSRLDHAVTPAYRSWLAANGFPMTISSGQVQAQLTAQGVDVAAALAAVGGRLTPKESAVLTSTLSKPVPLDYSFVYDGLVSIEPRTGAIVDVHTQRESLAAKPDLSGVAPLRSLLDHYATVPAVKAVSDGLDRLIRRPPDVAATFQFTETAASSRDVGNDARSQARLMNLLQVRAPWTVGVVGALLLLVAVSGLARRRRRSPRPVDLPDDEAVQPQRESATERVSGRGS